MEGDDELEGQGWEGSIRWPRSTGQKAHWEGLKIVAWEVRQKPSPKTTYNMKI